MRLKSLLCWTSESKRRAGARESELAPVLQKGPAWRLASTS